MKQYDPILDPTNKSSILWAEVGNCFSKPTFSFLTVQ